MSISSRVAECSREFVELKSRMAESSGDRSRLQDEYGRFQIWVGDVVAMGDREDGLESRLSEGQDLLKIRVLGLLNDLREELQAVGREESVESTDDEDAHVPLSDAGSASPIDILEDVRDTLDLLYRLAVSLRYPLGKPWATLTAQGDVWPRQCECANVTKESRTQNAPKAVLCGAPEGTYTPSKQQLLQMHESRNRRLHNVSASMSQAMPPTSPGYTGSSSATRRRSDTTLGSKRKQLDDDTHGQYGHASRSQRQRRDDKVHPSSIPTNVEPAR